MATAETQIVARTFADHMPILQVLIPFLSAPVIVIIGVRALAWPLAFAASLLALSALFRAERKSEVAITPEKRATRATLINWPWVGMLALVRG